MASLGFTAAKVETEVASTATKVAAMVAMLAEVVAKVVPTVEDGRWPQIFIQGKGQRWPHPR